MAPARKEAPSSSSTQRSKRVKFDAAEMDGQGDVDGDEDDLEDVKDRRAVNTEGYDSDSSDDGEGVVPSRKPGSGSKEDDSDDDMFASGPPAPPPGESTTTTAGKGKAKDKFLSLGDIEGQEFGNGDDEDGFESEDSKDGMGVELSSFNMKAELKEGAFTEDGSYVTNAKDRLEIYDRWLDGVDGKASMRKAREAKKKRDLQEEQRKRQEMEDVRDGPKREDLVAEIVGLLLERETVLKGLQRLGVSSGQEKVGKKLSWAEKQKERKKALAAAASGPSSSTSPMDGGMDVEPTTAGPTPFERLSTLTSDLTALGQLDLYNMTREALSRLLPPPPPPPASEPAAPSIPRPPVDDGSTYEYRYSMEYIRSLPESKRPIEREVFGPFPKPSILQWRAQGFFGGLGGAPEKVELRKVGGPSEWQGFWKLFG